MAVIGLATVNYTINSKKVDLYQTTKQIYLREKWDNIKEEIWHELFKHHLLVSKSLIIRHLSAVIQWKEKDSTE